MEEVNRRIPFATQQIFSNSIESNNEEIFMRHVAFYRKDRKYPINIQQGVLDCCQHGRVEMLKILLAFNSNVNFQNLENRRALHFAVLSGSLEIVKMIISAGSAVNCYDKMSYCPIHYACENGFAEIVHYLIQRGAHVTFSKIFTSGETPLHVACRSGHVEVVRVLLTNGADINCKLDQTKNCQLTPLHLAAKHNKCDVIDTLCSRGANVNARSSIGITPLHISAQVGDVNAVKTLLEYDADVSIREGSERGESACTLAIYEGHVEVVRTLLEFEPNIHCHSSHGFSALNASISGPNHQCFEILIKCGSDINEQTDNTQESLLMITVGLGDIPKIQSLLQYGANVNLPDFKFYTPLHRSQIIKESNDVKKEIAKILMKAGGKLNATDRDGFTPLHRAIFTNVLRGEQCRPCIQLLVESGCRLFPGPPPDIRKSQSPLCWLTWNGQYAIAEYLVQAGWDMSLETWINIIPPRQQQYKLQQQFQQIAGNTRALKHYSRKTIRDRLLVVTKDRDIIPSISQLPLPQSLKGYLCLHDCQFKSTDYFDNL